MISIIRAKVKDAIELLKIKIEAFQEDVEFYGLGPPGYDSLEKQNQISKIRGFIYFCTRGYYENSL